MKEVRVFAPATISSGTSGFQVLGFALKDAGEEVVVRKAKGGITFVNSTGETNERDNDKKTYLAALEYFFDKMNIEPNIEVEFISTAGLAKGLGTRFSRTVASIFGANILFETGLSKKEMIPMVMQANKSVEGSSFVDNIAPTMYGDFAFVKSFMPLDLVPVMSPKGMAVSVVLPDIEVETPWKVAEIEDDYSLSFAWNQWQRIAGFIVGLMEKDFETVRNSLEELKIDKKRSALIPSFKEVFNVALGAGALGCNISGTGMAIYALCENESIAHDASKVLVEKLKSKGLESKSLVSLLDKSGVRLINSEK